MEVSNRGVAGAEGHPSSPGQTLEGRNPAVPFPSNSSPHCPVLCTLDGDSMQTTAYTVEDAMLRALLSVINLTILGGGNSS